MKIMLRPSTHIRYHIAAILAVHWVQFVAQYKRWIRPVVFENVRKVLACRSPVLGCHIYKCDSCGHVELIPHSCKSRFCPTCGKHATDVWADQVVNGLLDVAYHHLVMAIPWQLRIVIMMNRRAGLNLITQAATEAVQQWVSQCRIALNQPEPDDTGANTHRSWAQRQAEYKGIDPLLCPNCDRPLFQYSSSAVVASLLRRSGAKAGQAAMAKSVVPTFHLGWTRSEYEKQSYFQ